MLVWESLTLHVMKFTSLLNRIKAPLQYVYCPGSLCQSVPVSNKANQLSFLFVCVCRLPFLVRKRVSYLYIINLTKTEVHFWCVQGTKQPLNIYTMFIYMHLSQFYVNCNSNLNRDMQNDWLEVMWYKLHAKFILLESSGHCVLLYDAQNKRFIVTVYIKQKGESNRHCDMATWITLYTSIFEYSHHFLVGGTMNDSTNISQILSQ